MDPHGTLQTRALHEVSVADEVAQLEIVEDLLALRLAGIILVIAKIPPHVIRTGGRHEGRSIRAGPCRVVDSLDDLNFDKMSTERSIFYVKNLKRNAVSTDT